MTECLPWVAIELSNLSPRTKRWLEGEFNSKRLGEVKDLRCLPSTIGDLYNLSSEAKDWLDQVLGLKIINNGVTVSVTRKEKTMTNLKQQLVQKYTAKQEAISDTIEEFLGRVVEDAAERGIDKRTINVNKEELMDEGIGYDAFIGFLTKTDVTFTTRSDHVVIDLS